MENKQAGIWVNAENNRKPDKDGDYYVKDSHGVKKIASFYNDHWHSRAGHPVSEWLDESPIPVNQDDNKIYREETWREENAAYQHAVDLYQIYPAAKNLAWGEIVERCRVAFVLGSEWQQQQPIAVQEGLSSGNKLSDALNDSSGVKKTCILAGGSPLNTAHPATPEHRRMRLDLSEPAELAIRNAVKEVEKIGADVRLTKAVNLLDEARELVADFIDEQPSQESDRDNSKEEVK